MKRTRRARLLPVCLLPALLLLIGGPALGDGERPPVPEYRLPDGFSAPALEPRIAAAVRRAVADLRDPPTPDAAEEAARILAGLGDGALPAAVESLRGAPWHMRAALVSAIAEMDTRAGGAVLAAAAQDPSFAVREAAVRGLGKTGTPADVPVLLTRADVAREPVWRVRAAAAAALRRAVLRGVLDRAAGQDALVALLRDPDADARRAALVEIAPLAAPAALAHLIALFRDADSPREDRTAALTALRAYRSQSAELLPALRQGLIESDDPEVAAQAGAALLDLGGVSELDDEEVARWVLRQLGDAGSPQLRAALARRGPEVAPWLSAQALALADRIARRRAEHHATPLEYVIDTLLQVKEEAAFEALRDLSVGPRAEVLAPETRRFALRKVRLLFPHRLADELRAAFDAPGGRDVQRAILEALVATGGEDLAARLDAALADEHTRGMALDLLRRRSDLPAGPGLERIATDPAARDALREQAIRALAVRDPRLTGRIAAELLGDASAAVRANAVDVVKQSVDPAHFERLVERLAEEDGSDPSDAARLPESVEGATTHAGKSRPEVRRRRIRAALLDGLVAVGGERAREPLWRALTEEPDPVMRVRAAETFRAVTIAGDDARLLARLADEGSPEVRNALLGSLARRGESEAVRRLFEKQIRTPTDRHRALTILRAEDAQVLPQGLAEGLSDRAWLDDEREMALALLVRHGRAPGPDLLAEIVRGTHENSLAAEALRVLAKHEDAGSRGVLQRLLEELEDPEKLALCVEQLGTLRSVEAVPALLLLLELWRRPAFGAVLGSDPEVQVYRRTAVALGRCGTDEGARALVRHLLGPATSRSVAPYSVPGNGPFFPHREPAVKCVRGLVAGLAHIDDARCHRLVVEELARLRADAADLALSEQYVDGVARYLRHPERHGLPARRRPAAALALQRHVLRLAPRLSPLDVEMQEATALQLEAQERYAEALVAYGYALRQKDVEKAGREPEQRVEEEGKRALLGALAAAAEGRRDEALATLRALRADAPQNGQLAYYQGYGLVKLGLPGEEARTALAFAASTDERNPHPHLYLGWVAENQEGLAAALAHYDAAYRLDRKRVEDAGDEYRRHRKGKVALRSSFAYSLARALSRLGLRDEAQAMLEQAILRDDRRAARARADDAFAAWPDLGAVVEKALAAIPDSD